MSRVRSTRGLRRRLFGRFELTPGQHRPHTMRNGAFALLLAGFVLYAGYSRHIPFWPKGGDTVRAEFADASNVRGGQEVRVRGVKVGTVESVERAGGRDAATVKMRLTEDGRPALRSDARASIYWRTLLGRNMYIELDPGRSPRALDGAIPKTRTNTQVELDQAFEPLDARGRRSLQTMLDSFRAGFDGAAAGQTIDALAPALRRVAPGLQALRGRRSGDLQRLVDDTAKVTRALDRRQAELAGLIDGAATTLGVTAARRADLAATVQRAPATLSHTRAQLTDLRSTLDRLDPVASDLRPGARRLAAAAGTTAPALDAAVPLLGRAKPLLADLQPAVRRLRGVGRTGTPLVRSLSPTVDRAQEQILPWLTGPDKNTGRKVFQTIGPAIATLASLAEAYDANGHDVSFQGGGGLRSGGTLFPCEAVLTDPTPQQRVKCTELAKGIEALFKPGRTK
jgi:virulence factor Mce-like protein